MNTLDIFVDILKYHWLLTLFMFMIKSMSSLFEYWNIVFFEMAFGFCGNSVLVQHTGSAIFEPFLFLCCLQPSALLVFFCTNNPAIDCATIQLSLNFTAVLNDLGVHSQVMHVDISKYQILQPNVSAHGQTNQYIWAEISGVKFHFMNMTKICLFCSCAEI